MVYFDCTLILTHTDKCLNTGLWSEWITYDISRKEGEENIYTEADKDPLESLVRGGLQVEQGELVVGAVLGFMTNGLEQSRRTVQL